VSLYLHVKRVIWINLEGLLAATYHPSDVPLHMLLDVLYNAVDCWTRVGAWTESATTDRNLVAELKRNNLEHLAPWRSGAFNFGTRKPWKNLSGVGGKKFPEFRWSADRVFKEPRDKPNIYVLF